MPSEKALTAKQELVASLVEKLGGAVSGVLVDYKGINVADDTKLRRELREAGVEYMVVKNTLLRRAFQAVGYEDLCSALEGTTAIAMSKEDAKLSKKEYKKKLENYPYPSVSYEIADQIQQKSGMEVRVTVPGHTQRGGSPCPYDRVFASRLGSEAGNLILKGEYGFMVGYRNREIVKVPLEDVAGKLKTVDPNSSMVKEAKMLGISFGD